MKQSRVLFPINLVLLFAAATQALRPVARMQRRAPVRMAADVLASDRILIAPALATSNVAKLGEEAQAAVAATVKSAPTRWADRQLMKTRQRARTTRAMLMRL